MFMLAFYAFMPAALMYIIGLRKPILFYLAILIVIAVLIVGIVTGMLWSFFFMDQSYWHSMDADFPSSWFLWVVNNANPSDGHFWWILVAPYVLVADFFKFYLWLNFAHGCIPLFLAEAVTWWWILVHGLYALKVVGFFKEMEDFRKVPVEPAIPMDI
jgi:hypothetical protein